MSGGMGWGFPFMGMIFFILIIMGIVYFLKIISGKNDEEDKSHTAPIDILKQRYSRGEIDQKTFEEMKQELNK